MKAILDKFRLRFLAYVYFIMHIRQAQQERSIFMKYVRFTSCMVSASFRFSSGREEAKSAAYSGVKSKYFAWKK